MQGMWKKIIKNGEKYFDYRTETYMDYICCECYKKIYEEYQDKNVFNIPEGEKTIFIDVETTGLSADDEIVQVSIIDNNGNILMNEYCKPINREEWKEASQINNIYPEDVVNCKPYSFYKDKVKRIYR